MVHADPIDRSHPLFESVYHTLKEVVRDHPDVVDFHDLRIEGVDEPYRVSFDLVTRTGLCRSRYDSVYEAALSRLSDASIQPLGEVEIGVEGLVDSAPMCRKSFCLLLPEGADS